MRDWLAAIWFHEFQGSPVWGWLVAAVVFGAIITYFIGGFVLEWDLPNRCNSNGDCWPEY